MFIVLWSDAEIWKRDLFICWIRKLPRIEVFIFVLFFCQDYFLKKCCTMIFDGVFMVNFWRWVQIFPRKTFMMKTFISCFVSLFFFSDDRFISKYLLSRTDNEPEKSLLEGDNLLRSGFVSFFFKQKITAIQQWRIGSIITLSGPSEKLVVFLKAIYMNWVIISAVDTMLGRQKMPLTSITTKISSFLLFGATKQQLKHAVFTSKKASTFGNNQ